MDWSTPLPLAAAVAFIALGATALGTGLLLLINPQSRSVRWHAAFSCWVMAWLGLQGWLVLLLGGPAHSRALGIVVHMMPAFFVAAALVETRGWHDTMALAVVLLGALTAAPLNPVTGGAPSIAWQAGAWGLGGTLHYLARHDERGKAARRAGGQALRFALLVIVPIGVIGVIVVRGAFLLYALPALMIVIQFLIFIGVIHHRYYDIEVRAARSGELAAQAAEQERLALLGELSATLAHEIRNPLTGIRSLAQRLGEPLPDDRRQRYVDVVLGEIARLDRIVGSLLSHARRTALRHDTAAATALDAVLDDVKLLVDARARRAGVNIITAANAIVVAAPRDALAQALLNLMLNAVAHSPRGGAVEVTAGHEDGSVCIRVRDGGPGVPAELRERIFEPFHTTGSGTGLGLAVVRGIARDLDWPLGVTDAPGGGASFELRVPAARANDTLAATATRPGPS